MPPFPRDDAHGMRQWKGGACFQAVTFCLATAAVVSIFFAQVVTIPPGTVKTMRQVILFAVILGYAPPVFSCFTKNAAVVNEAPSPHTFQTCAKTPERHRILLRSHNLTALEQLQATYRYRDIGCTQVLQMTPFPANNVYIRRNKNGLVNTVVDAYSHHHNLILRPDDIWAAIMTQFSFYVGKHAADLRGKFVDFSEGRKELVVRAPGRLQSVGYDHLVKLMTQEIDRNLKDPQIKRWILPNFSTTTDNDVVTTGVIFMATVKKYFSYAFNLLCGIPSITLEGTVDDWNSVYGRLEKLKEFGLERWYGMLEPILRQFVAAREGHVDLDFWQRIAHEKAGGSGPSYLSGWITVFCVFDEEGNWIADKKGNRVKGRWLRIESNDIPTGVVEVPVKINDNGVHHRSLLFAGHLATEIKTDGVTIQPALGWAMALQSEDNLEPDSYEL